MSFIWPAALASLLLLPFLVAAYLWLLREAAAKRASLGSMGVVTTSGSPGSAAGGPRRPAGPLRHLPYAMFGLALVALSIGAARPQVELELPRRTGTVVLVVATPIDPRLARLAAACLLYTSPSPRDS